MNSKIESYFNGEMNKAERLSFLREINSNKELKEAFINYRNLSGLISLKDYGTDCGNAPCLSVTLLIWSFRYAVKPRVLGLKNSF